MVFVWFAAERLRRCARRSTVRRVGKATACPPFTATVRRRGGHGALRLCPPYNSRQLICPTSHPLHDFGSRRPRAPRKSGQKRLRRKTHFACAFRSILSATSVVAKISLYENQKSCIYCSHPASIGGAYASSRTLRRDAVDANGSHDERRVSGRPSRVVLISRRWDQAFRATSLSGDGGYQARHSKESTKQPLTPSAQGRPDVPVEPVVTNSCVFCYHRRLRVRPASGFPCAL
jgi:hypothetical protein